MKKKSLLLGIILSLFLLITAISWNFEFIFNSYYNSVLPQKKFIEIRPIVYGWPDDEMRKASDAGEIILGGDAIPYPIKKYAVLIKVRK